MIYRRAVVCVIILLVSFTGVHAYFDCPYSGPVEDETLSYDVTHYRLELQVTFPVDPDPGIVAGTATLKCSSLVDGLSALHIDFYKDADATVSGVTVDGSAAAFDFSTSEIIVTLDPPLQSGDIVFIAVDYQVQGDEHFEFKPNRPPKVPRLAVNRMVEASRWFPCLHDPRDKATYELIITVDDYRVVASNGNLLSEDDNGDGTKTYNWFEATAMASYLATVHVGEYVCLEDDFNGIPIQYFVEADKVDAAIYDFENDHEILQFYTSAFGEYPFEKVGLAQAILSGGMENQDMISYGLISGDRVYEDIFAHEISHMWWGDSVTLTDCVDTWLNEGFASYCEALWEEHFYGMEAYDQVMADFRESYFQEDANNRFAIYDPDIVWGSTVYRKGAWVMHMLRWVLGEDAFWTVLPEYYQAHKFRNATTDDFQAVCESHYGSSMDWFFQEWIYEPGYPEFEMDGTGSQASGTYRVHLTQIQMNAPYAYRMPMEIQVTSPSPGGTPVTHLVTVDNRHEYFDFAVEDPSSVECILDPSNKILKKITYTDLPDLGVSLWMPANDFAPGDTCACKVTVLNMGPETYTNVPLFVILDVYGSYFFWPGFTETANFQMLNTVDMGAVEFEVLPAFPWPEGAGNADSIIWYAAMVTPEMNALFGELDSWEFGWHN